jgi:outer membrane lipoprotein SlyB
MTKATNAAAVASKVMQNPGQTCGTPALCTPGGTTSAVLCSSRGVVELVNAVQQKGQGTGLGAVAGGVLGGVVRHQVGGGNGKTAMTVLGAIGGGLAGNEVEKRARSDTEFDIQVRMEDGNVRTFRCTQSMAVGTHVVVEGTTLRPAHATGSGEVPRAVRTSAPAGGKT